jgi:hypothetical protein
MHLTFSARALITTRARELTCHADAPKTAETPDCVATRDTIDHSLNTSLRCDCDDW